MSRSLYTAARGEECSGKRRGQEATLVARGIPVATSDSSTSFGVFRWQRFRGRTEHSWGSLRSSNMEHSAAFLPSYSILG